VENGRWKMENGRGQMGAVRTWVTLLVGFRVVLFLCGGEFLAGNIQANGR
jgi:hypothetical protein